MYIKRRLKSFIEKAETLGLSKKDIIFADEFLNAGEHVLCFEQIVTQLYEFDIAVDKEFYNESDSIAKSLKIPHANYSFIAELLK